MSAAPVRVPTTSSAAGSETTSAATGPAGSTPVRPAPPGQQPRARSKGGSGDGDGRVASQREMYRRLLAYLRPHRWLMVRAIASSILAAALDAFSFALLIPFLESLFGGQPLPVGTGPLTQFLSLTIGSLLDPADKMGSLEIGDRHHARRRDGQEHLRLARAASWARSSRSTSRATCATSVYAHLRRLPLPVFHADERAARSPRTHPGRHRSDQGADHAAGDVRAPERRRSSSRTSRCMFAISWRLSLIALVVAPAVTGYLAAAPAPAAQEPPPPPGRLRRDDERVAGGRGWHAPRQVVPRRAVRGARFVEASGRYSQALVRVTKLALLSQPITEILGTVVAVGLLWMAAREVLVEHTLLGSQLIVVPCSAAEIAAAAQAGDADSRRRRRHRSRRPNASSRSSMSRPRPRTDRGTRMASGDFDSVAIRRRVVRLHDGRRPVLVDVSFTVATRRGRGARRCERSWEEHPRRPDPAIRASRPRAAILLGGVDTRDIALPSLRALTGIVSQDTVLFNDTVRRNIAYGGEGPVHRCGDRERCARGQCARVHLRAARRDTRRCSASAGTRLSGGQRQRLAIARALLTDPPILILDEATSSLDTESERLVQEAIDRLLAGRTVFVIAHRLSTMAHADQILVLDRGRVVERGTHAELLAVRGAYHRLYSLQFRDGEGVEEEASTASTANSSSS